MTTTETILLEDIILDAATQARDAVSEAKIAEYAALYLDGVKLDPIAVIEGEIVLE